MNKVMTTQTIAKAKEMKLAGKKTLDIAEELGVNPYTLKTYLKGIPSPNCTRVTDEQKKQIVALHQQGLSTYQIGDELDLAQSTVQSYIRKAKKEPATAATVTDSQKTDVVTENSTVSISKDNTIEPKSQVLLKYIKCDLYGIYEKLSQAERNAWDLGEMYARVTDHLKEVVGE